uniref:Nucleoporin 160 n=1 Tax=Salmo trutta TaxID=8032 RepID=A0A674CRL3_SALTR
MLKGQYRRRYISLSIPQRNARKMAAVLERSFIEISGFERETLPTFREITLNLGLNALPGSVIYPDSAGGFHYEGSGKLLSITSNRFIHWSTSGDTVQLVEQSLDTNLLNNAVKLKITHCPLLPGGVHVQETLNNVTILIVTNQTVHRLVLPHPTRMYRSELVTELQMQSIFTDVGKMSLQDPAHSAVIPSPVGQTVGPTASAAWLSHQGEAHYALASPAGGILVVTLPPHDTKASVTILELKTSSVMQRLAGWMPTAIRGEQSPGDLALSLAVRELEDDTFILALCQDHKLRMWSYRDQACLMEADMLEYMPACRGVTRSSGQGHRLRLTFSSTGLCLAIYLAVPSRGQFTVLQLVATDNNRYSLDHISSLFATQETLVDFALTSTDIWGLWLDDTNQTVVKYINFEHSVTEFEFSQEEYRQLQVEFWSKFYACCLQYQEALATPLGLLLNPHTHMVCVLKKGFVSFLVPCFPVEHLYLSFDEYLFSEEETHVAEDPEVGRDVLQLVQCLRLVSDAVPGDMAYEMEKALEHLQSPERAAEMVLENLLANDNENVIEDIHNKLQDVRNPLAAMAVLIREMDLETDSEPGEGSLTIAGQSLSWRISLSQLYGSSVAVAVVCQAVCQMAMTRALFCRDLLILQQLYLRLGDNVSSSTHTLRQKYKLNSAWLTLCSPSRDANLQHLSVLELSDSPAMASNRSVRSPQTVVELFYQSVARKAIITQIYSKQHSPSPGTALLHWPHMVSSVVTLLAQQLWPNNLGFQFPECLMGNCQYAQLQEYVRLIEPWCQVNVGSCRFMLGQCYLANGEGQKALQCFQEAAVEVEREEFLLRLTGAEEKAAAAPRLQYYNKVLRLLEDVGLPELVIHLATLAITEAVNDPRSQAALWTRIFKHHLDLGHNSQAYEALTQNPDSSSQLDCLRQLVVVLCERSQLQDLVQFSYVNLHDEVVSIIESRARAVDLMSHNYYELLYTFHINRHNYRKAGTVMFEYGMRLGREVRTQLGLQKQVNCCLASLNCLRLIRSDYAWIVQPTSGAVYERPAASPKRNYDGEFTTGPVSGQIDILELKDLQKEYDLARSRLTLAQHHPPSAAIAGSASAVEMMSLLVQSGLFDCALSLCQTFKLSLTSVFEGLAFKCIKLQYGGEENQNEAWNWLAANQLCTITTKESRLVKCMYSSWYKLASEYHIVHLVVQLGILKRST